MVSDAELANSSLPSPLSANGTQTVEQDGGSDDEDRNELFAILQEASSDEEEEGDEEDAQEDEGEDNELNVDIEMEDTEGSFGETLLVIGYLH